MDKSYQNLSKIQFFTFHQVVASCPKNETIEAVIHRCSSKQVFIKILQISQENTYVVVPQVCNFIKKRLQHRCFPVKFAKFLRTSLTTTLRWLLPKSKQSLNKLNVVLNPFLANVDIFCLPKKARKHLVFSCFQGVQNGNIG